MRLGRIITVVSAAALLGGCGITSAVQSVATSVIDTVTAPLEGMANPSPTATEDTDRLDMIAFASAYCRGEAQAALAATREIVQKHPNSPKAKLIHAMALDLGGHGIDAYRTLEPLATASHGMPAVLKCGDTFIYSGSVTEVAQRRLFEVGTELKKLGMVLPLPDQQHAGAALKSVFMLASTAPTRIADAPLPPQEVKTAEIVPPTQPVETNATPSPMRKPVAIPVAASHFVHLGSYRSKKMLDKGWKSLKKRYGRLLASEQMTVTKIDLGKPKGKYLRLGVSVAGSATANRLCGKLKSSGQYCAVMRTGKS